MKEKKKTLLVIRTSALGDVAMSIPVIYSLARQYPDMQVVVLTQAFFSRLFVNPPTNLSFVIADWKGKHRSIRGLARLMRELLALPITHVADLHNVLRSWLIDICFSLKGVPVGIVDKNRRKRKGLTRLTDKTISCHLNYIERYAAVLKGLNLPVKLDFISLFSADEQCAIRLPLPMPTHGSRLVGIAPFARYFTKTYPLPLMEQVVSELTSKGYHVFLFGSPGKEAMLLKDWEEKYTQCTALPGLLTLHEELVLMSRIDVMLSMDSANMHLASLVHTPVVSLWGGTSPQCGFMGWKQKEENAICLQLPCQPCSISGSKECPLHHFSCMTTIMPHHICERIERHFTPKP